MFFSLTQAFSQRPRCGEAFSMLHKNDRKQSNSDPSAKRRSPVPEARCLVLGLVLSDLSASAIFCRIRYARKTILSVYFRLDNPGFLLPTPCSLYPGVCLPKPPTQPLCFQQNAAHLNSPPASLAKSGICHSLKGGWGVPLHPMRKPGGEDRRGQSRESVDGVVVEPA